jgi:quercetin dioxygenase-like cupin family protein
MKVIHGREEGRPSAQRTKTVTGQMWGDSVLDGGDTTVNSVFFAPGARTHWHRHDGAQVLLITQGKGYVVTAAGHSAPVTAGDVVYAPPGEDHWHGAAKDSFVQHTAITTGKTSWLDPVDDVQYGQAHGTGTEA